MSSPGSAESFFARAATMAGEGLFEYAIDLYLDGLKLDPDNVAAHQALREAALQRKSAGGQDLAMLQKVKLRKPAADPVGDLLNTEKLLAYDPLNLEWLAAAVRHASAAKLANTWKWLHGVYSAAAAAPKK
jgi:hypothetical protein